MCFLHFWILCVSASLSAPNSHGFLRIWASLGEPGRSTGRTAGCGERTAIDSPGHTVPGYSSSWAGGQGLGVYAVPHSSAPPHLTLGQNWGVRSGGLLGVPSEMWVLYLLFHIGSWKGKPIPAQHCCLTWLIRSHNPAVEILGLTQNNRDQEYCG